jgi:hypothetical protein
MKKNILLVSSIFIVCNIFAQDKKDISKFTSQKSQYGFIENKGQIHDQNNNANPDVKYLLCLGNGMNVQLKANGFSYDTYNTDVKEKKKDATILRMRPNEKPEQEIYYFYHRVDIELIGANTNPQIIAEEPSAYYTNYYNSVTPECGVTFVRDYKRIVYKNIYSGIDMVFEAYSTNEKPIEYTFIVHPGADAKQIKLHYIGANKTELIENKINIEVAQGKFTECIPSSWINETENKLDITYKNIEKNIFGFNIPVYDKSQTLIIDPNPNLEWGTYYGDIGQDIGFDIKCDSSGNIYIVGETGSSIAIATNGVYQDTLGGVLDAFVAKFNSNGVRLWCSYYGGNDWDYGKNIVLDNNGNILIDGWTLSTNAIASIGAHQTIFGGGAYFDAFVVKFNNNGVRQWGTYYGGSDEEFVDGIASDSNGNIFITGFTLSINSIATLGAHQFTYSGGSYGDAFVVKFDSNGVRQWGTYYGGNYADYGTGIVCDVNGNLFVSGYTGSSNAISTSGVHQNVFGGGSYDAFIVKFDNNGVRLWGTYYGGIEDELDFKIALDHGGNFFITGYTFSPNAISTIGSYQYLLGGGLSDACVVKFNNSGVRQWGTYFGGSKNDLGFGITCDDNDNVFITGYTLSIDAIATQGSYQDTLAGGSDPSGVWWNDVFVAKFDSSGVLQWGTYYGGMDEENGYGIACDNANNTYITGATNSTSLISTVGAFQENGGGQSDVFIAKFSSCNTPLNAGTINGPTTVCKGQNMVIYSVPAIANATSYAWILPAGASGSSSSSSITVNFDTTAMSGSIKVKGQNNCGLGAESSLQITVNNNPYAYFSLYPDTLLLHQYYAINMASGTPPLSYFWDWGDSTHDTLPYPSHTYSNAGFYTICLTITNANGCNNTYCDSSYLSKDYEAMIYVNVIPPTGLTEFSAKKSFSVYPNPVSNQLSIEAKNNKEKLNFEIINSIGQVVYKGILQEKIIVPTANFASGVYLIKLENGKVFEFKKIVKE